jgi:hypothetical protein
MVRSELVTIRPSVEPTCRVEVALPPGVVAIVGGANALLVVTAILRRALMGTGR